MGDLVFVSRDTARSGDASETMRRLLAKVDLIEGEKARAAEGWNMLYSCGLMPFAGSVATPPSCPNFSVMVLAQRHCSDGLRGAERNDLEGRLQSTSAVWPAWKTDGIFDYCVQSEPDPDKLLGWLQAFRSAQCSTRTIHLISLWRIVDARKIPTMPPFVAPVVVSMRAIPDAEHQAVASLKQIIRGALVEGDAAADLAPRGFKRFEKCREICTTVGDAHDDFFFGHGSQLTMTHPKIVNLEDLTRGLWQMFGETGLAVQSTITHVPAAIPELAAPRVGGDGALSAADGFVAPPMHFADVPDLAGGRDWTKKFRKVRKYIKIFQDRVLKLRSALDGKPVGLDFDIRAGMHPGKYRQLRTYFDVPTALETAPGNGGSAAVPKLGLDINITHGAMRHPLADLALLHEISVAGFAAGFYSYATYFKSAELQKVPVEGRRSDGQKYLDILHPTFPSVKHKILEDIDAFVGESLATAVLMVLGGRTDGGHPARVATLKEYVSEIMLWDDDDMTGTAAPSQPRPITAEYFARIVIGKFLANVIADVDEPPFPRLAWIARAAEVSRECRAALAADFDVQSTTDPDVAPARLARELFLGKFLNLAEVDAAGREVFAYLMAEAWQMAILLGRVLVQRDREPADIAAGDINADENDIIYNDFTRCLAMDDDEFLQMLAEQSAAPKPADDARRAIAAYLRTVRTIERDVSDARVIRYGLDRVRDELARAALAAGVRPVVPGFEKTKDFAEAAHHLTLWLGNKNPVPKFQRFRPAVSFEKFRLWDGAALRENGGEMLAELEGALQTGSLLPTPHDNKPMRFGRAVPDYVRRRFEDLPDAYTLPQLARRIHLEELCLDAQLRHVRGLNVPRGSIVSFNLTTWLFNSKYNPWARAGAELDLWETLQGKVVAICRAILDARAVPVVEIVEGKVGNKPDQTIWDFLAPVAAKIVAIPKYLAAPLGVAVDDQFSEDAGSLPRMQGILQSGLDAGWNRFLVKIDHEVLWSFLRLWLNDEYREQRAKLNDPDKSVFGPDSDYVYDPNHWRDTLISLVQIVQTALGAGFETRFGGVDNLAVAFEGFAGPYEYRSGAGDQSVDVRDYHDKLRTAVRHAFGSRCPALLQRIAPQFVVRVFSAVADRLLGPRDNVRIKNIFFQG